MPKSMRVTWMSRLFSASNEVTVVVPDFPDSGSYSKLLSEFIPVHYIQVPDNNAQPSSRVVVLRRAIECNYPPIK